MVLKLTAFNYAKQAEPANEVTLTVRLCSPEALTAHQCCWCRLPPNVSSAQVSSSSNPATVAGAIAGKVREEKPVCTKSLGADSVANAIYSIAFARLYLADDNLVSPPPRLSWHWALAHRCGAAAVLSCALRAVQDICCLPEFVKEESASGETVSVMKLAIAIQE